MVRFMILSTLFHLHDVQAFCPDLKNYCKENYLDTSDFSNIYLLQYKAVDQHIQSPFFVSDGVTKDMELVFRISTKAIVSSCKYHKWNATLGKVPTGTIIYKTVNLNQTNKSNILVLDYVLDILASGTKDKMNEIHIIDYLSEAKSINHFISLYGCKMVNIDGNLTKFEGVLIFSNFYAYVGESISKFDSYLIKTYSFLQDVANISNASLTYLDKGYIEQPSSCNDIIKRQKEIDVAAEEMLINQHRVFHVFLCASFLIVLVAFIITHICDFYIRKRVLDNIE